MIDTLLAMDPALLATFVAAGIALNLTPGADVVFAMACGAQGGARTGIAAAAGISLGSLVHVALTAAGLAALIAAVPHGLDAVRWGGATYLLWLAWQSWRAGSADAARAALSMPRAFLRGALTNLLNPKVALFILAFLPQFTDPAAGPVWQQIAGLGLIFAVTGFVITGVYGAFAGAFGAALHRQGRLLNRLAAVVFAGLAARLVLD